MENYSGPDLTISIVSTNERHHLDLLLPQLFKVTQGIEKEIVIVDNYSDDGTADLTQAYPSIQLIKQKTRRYFSFNHNEVIRSAKSRYILLLNPDILFNEKEPCITRMVQFMDDNPDCGLAGCRVYNDDKQFAYPARRYPKLAIVLSRRIPWLYYSKKQMDRYLFKEKSIYGIYESDWLSGCFLMIRKEALEQTGLLDEKYLKYFEDVDICKRMHCFGWKVLYNGETYYIHLEKRSSKKIISRDALMHIISWFRWIFRQGYYDKLERKNINRR
jgi:N-acetylglucosaminyl-diphospho-decaprenol L-rhamnosyltransferase